MNTGITLHSFFEYHSLNKLRSVHRHHISVSSFSHCGIHLTILVHCVVPTTILFVGSLPAARFYI